jgi:hypothetical protein
MPVIHDPGRSRISTRRSDDPDIASDDGTDGKEPKRRVAFDEDFRPGSERAGDQRE